MKWKCTISETGKAAIPIFFGPVHQVMIQKRATSELLTYKVCETPLNIVCTEKRRNLSDSELKMYHQIQTIIHRESRETCSNNKPENHAADKLTIIKRFS
jgi:hypothetical protein